MGVLRTSLVVLLLSVAATWIGLQFVVRVNIPPHMLGHPSEFIEGLLTPEQGRKLLELAKEMKDFPMNLSDLKFYQTKHEHIGEAQPIKADGTCDHPYLVPSINKTGCVLPGRIDVGRHFLLTGGVEGRKEPYEDGVARLLSFGRYQFDVDKYEIVSELFHSETFQNAAKAVCPANKQVLDPFQFNFIVQVPGQTVALHVDGVYFWGATRFQFPQWLLAVMQFSGLFQDRFVDQIQVVGYFHQWEPTPQRGGEFVFWDSNNPAPKRVPPKPLAGSVVDGSKTVHAATVYQPHVKAPVIDKSAGGSLVYIGNDQWKIVSNGTELNTYHTDDLRWTIVYRARCFASEEEILKWKNADAVNTLELDQVLQILKADLAKRARLPAEKTLAPLDFAMLLMDEYVRYPLPPDAVIPYNYCAMNKLFPSLTPVLNLICQ